MRISKFGKMLAVLLAVLLLLPGTSVALAAGSPSLQVYRYVFDEQEADGSFVQPYYTDMRGGIVDGPQEGSVYAADDTLPSSYDARTQDIITTPKYQAGTGSCWAFATISCMETSMILQGYTAKADTDYSEAYMTWFGQRQRTPDTTDPTYGDGRNPDQPFLTGGTWQHSCATLMRGSGVQLESNAPWIETRDSAVMMQMAQPESDRYLSYARLWQTSQTNDKETAKRLLMQYGSLYSNYYDDTGITDRGYNKANRCYYQKAKTTTNHAITIVGWDDSFPASNFNEGLRPQHNGAWLIKGSWSTRFADGGYYWLSYDDPSNKEYVAIQAAPADIYDNIYQYDGAYCDYVTDAEASSASMANLFRADDRQLLTHVAAFNPNYGTTLKAQVYTGGTNYTLSGNDPTGNMTLRASKIVRDVGFGYVTVPLTQPILLEEDQAFTVVITLTDPNGGNINLPLEGESPSSYTGTTLLHGGNEGESFVKIGTSWIDTNNDGGNDYNNVPVKAMTRSFRTPTLTLASAPEKTTYFVGDTLDTAGLALNYSDELGSVSTVTEGIVCTPTQLDTIGTQTVTAAYNDLSVTFDVTVQPYETALSILTLPDKLAYAVGSTLDTTGLSLFYRDAYGAESTVTEGFTCTPSVLDTAGTQTVTVAYGGLTTAFDVFAAEITPQDGILTVHGGAAYPGETVEVTVSASINPGVATMLLNVGYDAQTLELVGVQNGSVFEAAYFTPGNDLTLNPYTVLWMDALGEADHTATGTLVTLTFRVLDTASAGDTAVTVTPGAGSVCNVDLNDVTFAVQSGAVHVKAFAAPTLTVLTAPVKTTYLVGETLDTAGLTLTYSDRYGETSTVTEGFVCAPTALDTIGTQTVTVTYADASASFDVTVQPYERTLTILTAPDQTEYYVGDTPDTTGLTLSYSDEYGVVSTVTEGFTCTPSVLNTEGTQTVTVTYGGLTAAFTVTVLPRIAETPVLAPQTGSTTVIDEENGFIYGLDFNMTEASLSDYLTVEGDGSFRVLSGAYIGTGTEIQLLDADGQVLTSYQIVIFGDVDGDGIASSEDIRAIKGHMNGAETLPDGSAQKLAADMDGDGTVDLMDSMCIKGILTGAVTYNQATRSTDD